MWQWRHERGDLPCTRGCWRWRGRGDLLSCACGGGGVPGGGGSDLFSCTDSLGLSLGGFGGGGSATVRSGPALPAELSLPLPLCAVELLGEAAGSGGALVGHGVSRSCVVGKFAERARCVADVWRPRARRWRCGGPTCACARVGWRSGAVAEVGGGSLGGAPLAGDLGTRAGRACLAGAGRSGVLRAAQGCGYGRGDRGDGGGGRAIGG